METSKQGTGTLLLKGGEVFDVSTASFRRSDILVSDGTIKRIGTEPEQDVPEVVDVSGKLVLPGLVDFHTHVFWGSVPLGVNPEKLFASSGVFTFLDFGSAGAANFEGFYYHVIRPSRPRVLAFLNLSTVGLSPVTKTTRRFGELFDPRLMDVQLLRETVEQYPDVIRGIKVRLGPNCSGDWGEYALKLARRTADELNLPLAVHATEAPPFLDDVLAMLGPGDILTHCYCHDRFNRILDEDGSVRSSVREARNRGVLFDLGHGVSNFTFEFARRAIEQEFLPDFLSSDVHAYNVDGPVRDLPTTISKMVSCGMSLADALYRSTMAPAKVLGLGETVELKVGNRADLLVASWSDSRATLVDSHGKQVENQHLDVQQVYWGGAPVEAVEDGRPEGKRK